MLAHLVCRRRRSAGLVFTLIALVLASSALAAGARADTTPIPDQANPPWADPTHQSALEVLAGQIASHIAGRTVTVRCEGPADWAALADQNQFDPNGEDGYVQWTWSSSTGAVAGISSVTELDGSAVCLPLAQFAAAATKPTKCGTTASGASVSSPVGKVTARTVPARRPTAKAPTPRTRTVTSKAAPSVPSPCYLGNGLAARQMPFSYWQAYQSYAWAMLTLAHEAIHLGGAVGGQLADGTAVGDPGAEAKADCYGMQWIPYVAGQLGDTPDDAQAIAAWVWDYVYASIRDSNHPDYWSADCRPGGALDVRGAGVTAWP